LILKGNKTLDILGVIFMENRFSGIIDENDMQRLRETIKRLAYLKRIDLNFSQ